MQDSFLAYFTQGGPILWVLIACSILLVALIVERWAKFRALDVDQEWLLAQMSLALQARDVGSATRTCQQAPGSLARVFEAGLYRADHSREEIESAMATRITQQSQLLERNMSAIGTMAVVAPFIGLFGTVLGIVRSFKELGGNNPAAVNAGIAEALASTAAGLFVAILAVVCFNYFKNRVRAMVSQMHVAGAQLVEMMVLARSGRPFPQDLRGTAPTPLAAPYTSSPSYPTAAAPAYAPPTTPLAQTPQVNPYAPPPTWIPPQGPGAPQGWTPPAGAAAPQAPPAPGTPNFNGVAPPPPPYGPRDGAVA